MKPKEIVLLIVATVAIIASVYFGFKLLNPKPAVKPTTEADKIKSIPSNIDEETYARIKNLSDYGLVDLSGMGKTDIFADF